MANDGDDAHKSRRGPPGAPTRHEDDRPRSAPPQQHKPAPRPKEEPTEPPLIEVLGEVLQAVIEERVIARLGKQESKLDALIEDKLGEAIDAKLRPLEARLKTIGSAPSSGREPSEREVEKRLNDLSASIESAAVGRAIDALTPRMQDLVSEKVRAAEGKLASRIQSLQGDGGGGHGHAHIARGAEGGASGIDSAAIEKAVEAAFAEREKKQKEQKGSTSAIMRAQTIDPAVIESKVESVIAEKLRSLEAKLTKAIDSKARDLADRIDEASKSGGKSVNVAMPTGSDLDLVIQRLAELVPAKVAKVLAEDVGVLVSRDVARIVPEKVANNMPDALDQILPEKLAEILPGEVAAALQEHPPSAMPDLSELEAKIEAKLVKRMKELSGGGGGGSTDEIAAQVANSTEFKQLLDKKFRTLLQHVEGEIVPKVLTRKLSSSGSGDGLSS